MGRPIPVSAAGLPAALRAQRMAMRAAIAKGAFRGAHRGRAIIVPRTPTDQGQLRNSWRVDAHKGIPRGSHVVLAELLNDAPHAGVVEMGARPHKVSREGWEAIYEWVRRHFFLTGAGTGKVRRRGGGIGEDPELAGITWAIVKRLEREGQEPTYFVKDSLAELGEALAKEVRAALERLAERGGRGGQR